MAPSPLGSSLHETLLCLPLHSPSITWALQPDFACLAMYAQGNSTAPDTWAPLLKENAEKCGSFNLSKEAGMA